VFIVDNKDSRGRLCHMFMLVLFAIACHPVEIKISTPKLVDSLGGATRRVNRGDEEGVWLIVRGYL
jgi:hypothetical protein